MDKKSRKPGSGGRRPGAGRKPGATEDKRIKFTVTLPARMLTRLDEESMDMGKSRSDVVEMLLSIWLAGKGERKMERKAGDLWYPLVDTSAIGIVERKKEMLNEYIDKFGELSTEKPAGPLMLAMSFYQNAIQGGHCRIAQGAMKVCDDADLMKVVDFVGEYAQKDVHKFWRAGSWWLVHEEDPNFLTFRASDARHKKE